MSEWETISYPRHQTSHYVNWGRWTLLSCNGSSNLSDINVMFNGNATFSYSREESVLQTLRCWSLQSVPRNRSWSTLLLYLGQGQTKQEHPGTVLFYIIARIYYFQSCTLFHITSVVTSHESNAFPCLRLWVELIARAWTHENKGHDALATQTQWKRCWFYVTSRQNFRWNRV